MNLNDRAILMNSTSNSPPKREENNNATIFSSIWKFPSSNRVNNNSDFIIDPDGIRIAYEHLLPNTFTTESETITLHKPKASLSHDMIRSLFMQKVFIFFVFISVNAVIYYFFQWSSYKNNFVGRIFRIAVAWICSIPMFLRWFNAIRYCRDVTSTVSSEHVEIERRLLNKQLVIPDSLIAIVVPSFREDELSMSRTIHSIVDLVSLGIPKKRRGDGSYKFSPSQLLPVIIVDEDWNDPANTQDVIKSILTQRSKESYSRPNFSVNCSNGENVAHYVINYESVEFHLFIKKFNGGKRMAQVHALYWLQKYHFLVRNIDYVMFLDSDTIFPPLSVWNMLRKMQSDQNLLAITGEVSVNRVNMNYIQLLQSYVYFIGCFLGKGAEAALGVVTCLPGCFTMFRGRAVLGFDEGKLRQVIDKLAAAPQPTSILMCNILELGEDRSLTTWLLEVAVDRPHHVNKADSMKISFIHNAPCETDVPKSFLIYLRQQRRWINSTLANQFVIVQQSVFWKKCLELQLIVSMDFVSSIIMPAMFFHAIGIILESTSAALQFFSFNLAYLELPLILVWIFTQLHVQLYFAPHGEFFFRGILSIVCIPCLQAILPFYTHWKWDDFSWGGARQRNSSGLDSIELTCPSWKPCPICSPILWKFIDFGTWLLIVVFNIGLLFIFLISGESDHVITILPFCYFIVVLCCVIGLVVYYQQYGSKIQIFNRDHALALQQQVDHNLNKKQRHRLAPSSSSNSVTNLRLQPYSSFFSNASYSSQNSRESSFRSLENTPTSITLDSPFSNRSIDSTSLGFENIHQRQYLANRTQNNTLDQLGPLRFRNSPNFFNSGIVNQPFKTPI